MFNIFFDPSLRIMEIKTKLNKWDLLKLKIFCRAKGTINKTKRQSTDWDKIFVNVTNKELVSKIYKQFITLKSIKTNNPLKIWAEGLNRHFSKEDIQVVIRYMERHSTSLVIRKMQVKTTVRYHHTLVRMAIIKKIQTQQMLERVWREGNPPALLMGM